MNVCRAADCESGTVARGWCGKHYQRWAKHGNPETVLPKATHQLLKGQPRGSEHWNWKGEERTLAYRSAHERVNIAKGGKASQFPCSGCGKKADEWAYDHAATDEESDERGRAFSADTEHYLPMCRSCHRTADWNRTRVA